jgi:hypothetical protein
MNMKTIGNSLNGGFLLEVSADENEAILLAYLIFSSKTGVYQAMNSAHHQNGMEGDTTLIFKALRVWAIAMGNINEVEIAAQEFRELLGVDKS